MGFLKKSGEDAGTTEVWQRYERGVDHHRQENLYETVAQAYRMYQGEQWYGLEYGGEKLPAYNFIAPTVEYKTAMVAMQNMQIVYSPMDIVQDGAHALCDALNRYAAKHWEAQKLESRLWDVARAACIAGDSYLYFYNKNLDAQLIDSTSIYFADEQESDIQKQEYIIIYERRPVAAVRREARANGLSREEAEKIQPDEDLSTVSGGQTEVKSGRDGGKCSSLIYLYRDAGGSVHTMRSTKTVIYRPDTAIPGMTMYPLAAFVWVRRRNSARGLGEVTPIVPNQIEANRLLARQLISAKQNAFAKPVFVENMVENPDDVEKVGKAVRLRGSGGVQRINDIFTYISPAPMSGESHALLEGLVTRTRELSGAGDAALGNVNPEKASGAAIIAVRDQSAIPLNEQIAAFRQFVEDIALVWLDIWRAYSAGGIVVYSEEGGLVRRDEISPEAMESIQLRVRIDATSANPFSRYAEEQSIENARNAGYISFEEYVRALPENSVAPKHRLKEILDRRAAEQAAAPGMPIEGIGL